MASTVNLNGVASATAATYSASVRPSAANAVDNSEKEGSATVKAETQSGSTMGSGTSKKEMMDRLQKQITDAAKHLRELQQQLQQAQSKQASSEEKNAEIAAIQAQIASASASMLAMQDTMTTLQLSAVDTSA